MTRESYKGFLITEGFDGIFYVTKDATTIARCTSLRLARAAVDEVTK